MSIIKLSVTLFEPGHTKIDTTSFPHSICKRHFPHCPVLILYDGGLYANYIVDGSINPTKAARVGMHIKNLGDYVLRLLLRS